LVKWKIIACDIIGPDSDLKEDLCVVTIVVWIIDFFVQTMLMIANILLNDTTDGRYMGEARWAMGPLLILIIL